MKLECMTRCLLFLLLTFTLGFSQDNSNVNTDELVVEYRAFNDNIRQKYNSEDFQYIEPEQIKNTFPEDKPSTSISSSFLSFLFKTIGIIAVLIALFFIIKAIIEGKINMSFGESGTKKIKTLDIENIDVETQSTNLSTLLRRAVDHKEYRLAVRYYYLIALQKMGDKHIIKLHKDKTNTDYLYEIKNTTQQQNFAHIAYLYDYIWYGEFPVDDTKFLAVEQSFKTHLNSI